MGYRQKGCFAWFQLSSTTGSKLVVRQNTTAVAHHGETQIAKNRKYGGHRRALILPSFWRFWSWWSGGRCVIQDEVLAVQRKSKGGLSRCKNCRRKGSQKGGGCLLYRSNSSLKRPRSSDLRWVETAALGLGGLGGISARVVLYVCAELWRGGWRMMAWCARGLNWSGVYLPRYSAPRRGRRGDAHAGELFAPEKSRRRFNKTVNEFFPGVAHNM
jgi:hypothetical protein